MDEAHYLGLMHFARKVAIALEKQFCIETSQTSSMELWMKCVFKIKFLYRVEFEYWQKI
jgi:hypothetical protein